MFGKKKGRFHAQTPNEWDLSDCDCVGCYTSPLKASEVSKQVKFTFCTKHSTGVMIFGSES